MSANDVATLDAGRGAGSTPANRTPVAWRIAATASWVLVFALWTATLQMPYVRGFLFVLLGTCALLFTTVATAGRTMAGFLTMTVREAAARSAWTSGALGTLVFFESALLGPSEGLAAAAHKLAVSFVPSLCGCILAAGLLVSMLRAAPGHQHAHPLDTRPGVAWDAWLGRTLFVVLVAWPLLQARLSVEGPRLVDSLGMLHWPAVLVLVGTLAAMRLLGGEALRERAASAALAGAGTLTALFGLVQALLGIAHAEIAAVVAGIGFMITACFATLLALALFTYPPDDRCIDGTHRAPLATRVAWVLFPLLTIGLMAVTFLMILTPMTRRL